MAEYQTLYTHIADGVLTITLNRPERRNAINPAMIAELTQALDRAAADSNCLVVILTGAGQAFCAGLDLDHLQMLRKQTAEQHRADSESIARLLRTLHDFPKPAVAAVNGAAVAGGMGLVTTCDFTLAVPEAKFGYTEVRIGFIPAIVSSFLIRQIGEKRARDLLLTGRLIDAQEALDLGLVTRVVSAEELLPEAAKLARSLLRNSPEAMQATKKLLSSHARAALDTEIANAIQAGTDARFTADFNEGIAAFLEKRPPAWPSRKGPASA